LAFDQFYAQDGTVVRAKTEFHVPNRFVLAVASERPGLFVPCISVHPYRPGALEEIDHWAARGVRFIKWLPNAMGMDPGDEHDERIVAFYRRMRAHRMILLTHTGEEQAVHSTDDQELGNPLRLRLPLRMGVRVIAAHCASLGRSADLDRGGQASNFELFLRLMGERRFEGLLFGEISAITQANRLSAPLLALLDRTDLHGRLVNGSDYPLPAINVLVRTGPLEKQGFITAEEREGLNEIYRSNPLLYDLVLKRTLRHPRTGKGFPVSVFLENPGLR
jgi:predicted TIM-barrel fold metal-dependent hydrolase